MEEEDDDYAMSARKKTTFQISDKGLQNLLSGQISDRDLQDPLSGMKTREDQQLKRVEDVERLTDIIHTYRAKGARSKEIACAIIKFMKEG